MGVMQKIVLVIPCYNEAGRLDVSKFADLLQGSLLSLLFVDDGSTDSTQSKLTSFCATHASRATLLVRPRNGGKASAVREGLLQAIQDGGTVVGYADADLATPPLELLRLATTLSEAPEKITVVMGSRMRRLGSSIQRSPVRHVSGRIFATLASIALGVGVYDTQCGAKYFRVDAALSQALQEPFHTRWIFDVELIARLLQNSKGSRKEAESHFLEIPLNEWSDVKGSKLTLWSAISSFFDLVKIYAHVRKHL
jgi:dolichyl-phosphate beta-glucosyltransferase